MHCGRLTDFLLLDELLRPEEKQAREAAARWVDDALPRIPDLFEAGAFPSDFVTGLGELGAYGSTLQGYGCPGISPVAYGLTMMELERGDSGLRSMASVQGMLVMWPLLTFGTEDQRARWLPRLRTGEAVGCFALTEPGSGSDPASMTTRARRTDAGWILDGHKAWITNGGIADVAVIWARVEEEGSIRAFLVERDTPGLRTTEVKHKLSLRMSVTSDLYLDGCEVPADAVLPGVRSLGHALKCLNEARYGIAWGVLGAAIDCYAVALRHAKERVQFGRPIGAFQLVQQKLVDMVTGITNAQNLMLRLGRLKEEGRLTPAMVSFAKRHCVQVALDTARTARDVLGASGVVLDRPVIRHMVNLETVRTYEGTHDVHTLALGRALTGLDAFGS